jgi:hypothetical protein
MMDILEERPTGLEPYHDESLDLRPLRHLESTKELCKEMKQLGAKYYEDEKDSREVKEFGLLDTESILHKRETI